jgi:hypothetical protein
MHRGFCFLSCSPEARRQGFVESNGCRSIAAGVNDPTSNVIIGCYIVTTSGNVNARPSHPSHQFG